MTGAHHRHGPQPSAQRTPELILGPFYPADRIAPRTRDLARTGNSRDGAAGETILICVTIADEGDRPLEGVCAEFWQANSRGRYRHQLDGGPAPLDPRFDGFGSQLSDARGRVSFRTIKPGAYRTPRGEARAPHIHFQITDGARRLVTQMFFPGEPLNHDDRCLQSCSWPTLLIAHAVEPVAAGASTFSWRIVLPCRPLAKLPSEPFIESQA